MRGVRLHVGGCFCVHVWSVYMRCVSCATACGEEKTRGSFSSKPRGAGGVEYKQASSSVNNG